MTGTVQTRGEFLKQAAIAAAMLSGGAVLAERARPAWAASADATLAFVGWQGYDGTPGSTFSVLSNWEKSNGLGVSATYISTNPEIVTKLQASPVGTYDLVTPVHSLVPAMIQAGLLEPIPVSQLQNWNSLPSFIRNQKYLRDKSGAVYAVPLGFGYQGVPLYNPALLKQPPRSYKDIFKAPYRGNFVIRDAPVNLTWMARTLGMGHPDPNHITRVELAKLTDFARQVIRAAKVVSPTLGDVLQLLVTKEVSFTVAGNIGQIAKAAAQGVTLKRFFPKEGSAGSYMDNYAIPKGAQRSAQALAWIDEMISPEVNAELASVYGGAVVNSKSVPFLSPGLTALFPYSKLSTFFSNVSPLYPPQPTNSRIYASYSDWAQAWNDAKQG